MTAEKDVDLQAEAEELAAELVDLLPPVTWDVTVWREDQSYMHGRLDVADQKRLIVAFLFGLRDSDGGLDEQS